MHQPRHVFLAGLAVVLAVVGLGCIVVAPPAVADPRPTVSGLSVHRGPYWGATVVTVRGSNFAGATKVLFGKKAGYALHVLSSAKLTVIDPEHAYGTVHVRVVTPSGASMRSAADRFTFTHPTMDTPIMGGLTAHQEQRISARVRAAHRGVYVAPWSRRWTPALGATAVRRARSWLGLPYSWAGGNGRGPTPGVCEHNGGDLDCHVIGFDCSGLALYAWSPYETLVHYAATQHWQAGRFHPTIGQLVPGDLVFFSGYIADGIGHVAVYARHGLVIQAAQSGTLVMRSRLVDVIAESGRYRGATRPMSTGRQGPPPVVSSFTGEVPATGGYVSIAGRNLEATTTVAVGNTLLYSFASHSARRVVVKVPAHAAGRISLAVSNPWGTARRTLNYVGVPQIAALSPSTGTTAGGTTVTISGRYLNTARQVTFAGAPVPFAISAGNRLTVTTPAHAPGSVQVVVHSAYGNSNAVLFTFTTATTPAPSPAPTSPPSGSSTAGPTAPAPGRRAPTVRPAPVRGGDQFFGDRIGDGWYLIGRRSLPRSAGRR